MMELNDAFKGHLSSAAARNSTKNEPEHFFINQMESEHDIETMFEKKKNCDCKFPLVWLLFHYFINRSLYIYIYI